MAVMDVAGQVLTVVAVEGEHHALQRVLEVAQVGEVGEDLWHVLEQGQETSHQDHEADPH